jgi:hypothetical protein
MVMGVTRVQAETDADEFARLRQFVAADESGVTSYHSEREVEVAKFLGKTNKALTAAGEPHPFSQFPPPSDFASMKDAVRALPALIRNLSEQDKRKLSSKTDEFRLSDVDDLPVWTGEAWVGGIPFILNGFDDCGARKELIKINNLERLGGAYLYSKEERVPKPGVLQWGLTYQERLHLLHAMLESNGLDVQFDKTFYIWRLVSTNVPKETLRGRFTPPAN